MKRWCVRYTQTGEVEGIEQSDQDFLGARPTPINFNGPFYCDAIDELGALARFMEAWEKYNETLLR